MRTLHSRYGCRCGWHQHEHGERGGAAHAASVTRAPVWGHCTSGARFEWKVTARPVQASGAEAGRSQATPIPWGSRPSIAALMRSSARNASEIVMLTCRTLQPPRPAMLSVFVVRAARSLDHQAALDELNKMRRPKRASMCITAKRAYPHWSFRGVSLLPSLRRVIIL